MWNLPFGLGTTLLARLEADRLEQNHANFQSTYRSRHLCMRLVVNRNRATGTRRFHCQRGMFGDIRRMLNDTAIFRETEEIMDARSYNLTHE